jgi:xanthine dehydrogenase YagS FAD-binding subunit
MHPFAWLEARSAAEAAAAARTTVADAMLADPGSEPHAGDVVLKAGGIDLIDLMKEDLLRPARVVNLRGIPGLAAITAEPDGVRLGALATLAAIARHPLLRPRYAALADAAGQSASPEIRNLATIGGNLLQRPRCWYFRSAANHCARKGGEHCFAFAGENHYHAVFGHDGCAMVHPSTAATALMAYGSEIELLAAAGTVRRVPFADFVVGPEVDVTRETAIAPGEVLTAVLLPALPDSARSAFFKFSEKPSFDWSVADVAVLLERAPDGTCRRAAVVLGAAAPVPWRARAAEATLIGRAIDAAAATQAAEAAVAHAEPLRHNAYKLPILAALVRRAVLAAAAA